MQKSKLIARSVWVLVGLVIAVAALFVPYHRSDMTVGRVQSLIDSALQKNADRGEVEKFLQKNGIPYSPAIGNSNVINASIQGTSKSFLITGSIFIVFTFDANARLIDSKVNEVYTGL